jgi:hypothetical protein
VRKIEKRALRRSFGPNRETIRVLEEVHNGEFHDFYSCTYTIRMTKSRRMTEAWHVAPVEGREMHKHFCRKP